LSFQVEVVVEEKRARWMIGADLISVWLEERKNELSMQQRASMVLQMVSALARTCRTRSIPCSTSFAFFFSIGLWTLLLTLSGSLLFPALDDSLTGLRVLIVFSFVVVKVRSVLRSKSLVCLVDLSNALSACPVLAEFSDKTGDPSSRTKGFSYSLARTGAARDAIPATLTLRRSAVEALRECEDAMIKD
jgi:hypothetical protein